MTDCNTLYVGSRKNALEHIDTAYANGFSPFSTGCNVIIADGLKGTDDLEVPVAGGELCKTARIGRAIMDADIVLSLNHFKGHEATGFGGCVKNLGMGSGSRAGKMIQHNAGKPTVGEKRCRKCHACAKICAHGAISFDGTDGKARIDHEKCVGCGRCIGVCNFDAIYNANSCANEELNKKMAEYAKAVIDGRPNFHISLVVDVSPYCDCHAENDRPIVPDIGMFASFDPIALDQACADACNAAEPICNSYLGEQMAAPDFTDRGDVFKNSMPETDWESQLSHGEKLGMGTRSYELVALR